MQSYSDLTSDDHVIFSWSRCFLFLKKSPAVLFERYTAGFLITGEQNRNLFLENHGECYKIHSSLSPGVLNCPGIRKYATQQSMTYLTRSHLRIEPLLLTRERDDCIYSRLDK